MVTKCRFSIQHYSLISKNPSIVRAACLCRRKCRPSRIQRNVYGTIGFQRSGRSGLVLLRWIPKVDVPESLPRIAVSEPSPDLLYVPLLPDS